MIERPVAAIDSEDLRRRAEETARRVAVMTPQALDALSSDELRRTLHELHVHQVELEMQNEELRRAQAELDAARARYVDLYELAPVGYCTLGEHGLVVEANLTLAALLGVTRVDLLEQPISRFIVGDDQDAYYRLRARLVETRAPQACELRMMKAGGGPPVGAPGRCREGGRWRRRVSRRRQRHHRPNGGDGGASTQPGHARPDGEPRAHR